MDARFDRFYHLASRIETRLQVLEYKLTAALQEELLDQTWKMFAVILLAIFSAFVGIAWL